MEIVVGTYEELLLGYRLKCEEKDFSLEMCFTNHSHKGCVKAVAVSSQGLLASGSSDESIQLFDLRRGKELGSLMHHEGSVTSLSFFGNTHLFSSGEDGNVCVWKTHHWECLRTLRGHKGPAYSVTAHPTGKMALSVSKDKTMRTWNLVKGRSAYITNLHEVADVVMWAPNGDRYIIVLNNKLLVYSVQTAQVENTLQKRSRITAVAFLHDGTLALSSEGGVVELYHISSMKKMYEFETNTTRVRGICCCLPPEGVEPECLVTASSDGHIKLWQITTATQEGTWSNTLLAEVDTKFRLTSLCVWNGKKRWSAKKASSKHKEAERPDESSDDEQMKESLKVEWEDSEGENSEDSDSAEDSDFVKDSDSAKDGESAEDSESAEETPVRKRLPTNFKQEKLVCKQEKLFKAKKEKVSILTETDDEPKSANKKKRQARSHKRKAQPTESLKKKARTVESEKTSDEKVRKRKTTSADPLADQARSTATRSSKKQLAKHKLKRNVKSNRK